jgi:DNA-binding transcriptional LysR family regulator
MDLITSINIFKQVVRLGSFTKAADQLHLSTAMVSKHVAFLENHLQARLLTRTSRRVSTTEVGQQFFAEASEALALLDQASERASAGRLKPKGQLKIAAPGWLATPQFAQWLADYHALYPEVTIVLGLDNRHVDLLSEGYDLALRVTDEPLPSLIVKPIATIEFFLVASHTYLAERGNPQTPQDLAHHQCILPTHTVIQQTLTHEQDVVNYHLPAVMYTNDTLMEYHLVKSGLGIAYLPHPIIQDDLKTGTLVRVLPDYEHNSAILYAAYINREYLSAKVRTFIDFLSQKIQNQSWI